MYKVLKINIYLQGRQELIVILDTPGKTAMEMRPLHVEHA